MTPDPRSRRQALRALRDARARAFVERVQAGDASVAELRELQDQLRLAEAACADPLVQRTARWRVLAGSLAAVAALCTLGALVPMRSAPFSAEIEADSATLQLARAGELGAQAIPRELQAEGYASADTADARLLALARAGAAHGLGLRSEGLRLRQLRWADGSLMRLEGGTGQVRITLETPRPAPVLSVETRGSTEVDAHDGSAPQQIDFGPGEWLTLQAAPAQAAGRQAAPVVLTLGSSASQRYQWRGLRPQAIGFAERQAGGSGEAVFASSLLRARLQLPASGSSVELQAGDGLRLEELVLERCEVSLGPTVTLRLSGTAGLMRSSVGGFERSLKPSVLEFLAHHHLLAALWGAAVFLWGCKTWLQKLLGNA